MPVGLTDLPTLHPVPGIRLAATAAGIRKQNRRDLVVIECAPGTECAATFTRNRSCAAPVMVAKAHLAEQSPHALLINTGFANAGTGAPGVADAETCCTALAGHLGCKPAGILPFSTGVIGERLPVERVINGLPPALAALADNGWQDAAHGIMTTDTVPKGSSRRLRLGGKEVTITGIAKGAGMIQPNMATMLAFVATDAAVSRQALQACVRAAVDQSFNRITVDGDTSTNDSCVLLATGRSGAPMIEAPHGDLFTALQNAVTDTFRELAQAIVRDAEGATKFITIHVVGGASEADALAVAYAVANSPLVKTAFFASDPNWGRILAAVGRAPVADLDASRVTIRLGEVCVVRGGAVAEEYTEAQGQRVMKAPEILVTIDLGAGKHDATVWTCDFSHDYVSINADYRS